MAPSARWTSRALWCLLLAASLSSCVVGPVEPDNAPNTEAAPTSSRAGKGGAGGPPEPLPSYAPTSPVLSQVEADACSTVYYSDVDALDAYNALAERPAAEQDQASRNQVADLFDQAVAVVQGELDRLPDGDVRSAVADYQAAQVQLRDTLRAGGDVSSGALSDALAELEAACGLG